MKKNNVKSGEESLNFHIDYEPPICKNIGLMSRRLLCSSLNSLEIDEETDMDA